VEKRGKLDDDDGDVADIKHFNTGAKGDRSIAVILRRARNTTRDDKPIRREEKSVTADFLQPRAARPILFRFAAIFPPP
jgi:hypothetical protein